MLVKASAGGGGRGMRVVRALAEVGDAVEQARAEAASAFGDATVFCEPYVERGRHVEVQVLADAHGPRQRRSGSATARCSAATRRWSRRPRRRACPSRSGRPCTPPPGSAAEAIGYVGAGTVEFLHDEATQRFLFLEMNTRLQVEHPVTECVTGLDLVALQIARGRGRLPSRSRSSRAGTRSRRGSTPRTRVTAGGRRAGGCTRFELGGDVAFALPASSYGVRVDAGFGAGDEVGTHYDAMLAKVVAWAPTRAEAVRRLAAVLQRAEIHGVATNRDLLVEVLRHEAFVAGRLDTDFLTRHDLASLQPRALDADVLRQSAFAAAVRLADRAGGAPRRTAAHPGGLAQRRLRAAAHRVHLRGRGGRRGVVRRPRRLSRRRPHRPRVRR